MKLKTAFKHSFIALLCFPTILLLNTSTSFGSSGINPANWNYMISPFFNALLEAQFYSIDNEVDSPGLRGHLTDVLSEFVTVAEISTKQWVSSYDTSPEGVSYHRIFEGHITIRKYTHNEVRNILKYVLTGQKQDPVPTFDVFDVAIILKQEVSIRNFALDLIREREALAFGEVEKLLEAEDILHDDPPYSQVATSTISEEVIAMMSLARGQISDYEGHETDLELAQQAMLGAQVISAALRFHYINEIVAHFHSEEVQEEISFALREVVESTSGSRPANDLIADGEILSERTLYNKLIRHSPFMIGFEAYMVALDGRITEEEQLLFDQFKEQLSELLSSTTESKFDKMVDFYFNSDNLRSSLRETVSASVLAIVSGITLTFSPEILSSSSLVDIPFLLLATASGAASTYYSFKTFKLLREINENFAFKRKLQKARELYEDSQIVKAIGSAKNWSGSCLLALKAASTPRAKN